MSKGQARKYSLVIFDWEGTLGDTVGMSLCRIATEASKQVLGSESNYEELFRLNLLQAAKGFFHNWSDEAIERYCLNKSSANCADLAEQSLLPGAKKLIEDLSKSGINLAIASNKGAQSLQSALQRSLLEPYFTVTRAAGQTPAKPCPQMLEEILMEFALDAQDALMIGDSVSDIEMAKQIGMDSLGFDFYHQNTESLFEAGALKVFDNYTDVAHFLKLPS